MGNGIRTMAAVAACKGVRGLLRLGHRGGTTVPGRAALKIDPAVLKTISAGMDVIVVTGTNGKTTTCRMLLHALESAGKDVLANRSGANLLPGIVAEFASDTDLFGHPKKKIAIIECDEGAMKQVIPLLKPRVIAVTNLFRDQLDRYGEITHTREAIRMAVKESPESILCLNADCSLTASIAEDLPNPVFYYGIEIPVGKQENAEISDARYCIKCGKEYRYSYHTYAHLGGFFCPSCGYSRRPSHYGVTTIRSMDTKGSDFDLAVRTPGQEEISWDVHCALPAVYNIYNAAAAVCAASEAGFDTKQIISSLADVTSSFGRMETFDLDGTQVQMILVKNPAGCDRALSYVASVEEEHDVVLCLNDRTADGHDISWIWDADFEAICENPHVRRFYVRGDRAEDMQLRLKYGGASEEKIELVRTDQELVRKMQEDKKPVFILPNYTSMLSLRAELSAVTGKQEFWKG
ncbi:MAG: DUF1727 domain-containing protein [Eubacterium sp.]|nr:DUF1727 domain-containing protein [Eubacterium sp.]